LNKLKIGDKVRLSITGKYAYEDEIYNPYHEVGTIVDIKHHCLNPIKVDWKYDSNSYTKYELEGVKALKEFKVGDKIRLSFIGIERLRSYDHFNLLNKVGVVHKVVDSIIYPITVKYEEHFELHYVDELDIILEGV
jgi:hypothetical protein